MMSEETQAVEETQVNDPSDDSSNFAAEAQAGQIGFFAEFLDFLLHNKKWWITPIVLVLLLVGWLALVGGTAAAPFIYTLF